MSGSYAQVAARLWDVAPDGSQTLVSHAFYRPRSDNANPQVFQLHPNGWRFAAGHAPKLELLGQSVALGRAPIGTFTVTVTRLDLRLPVRETPAATCGRPPRRCSPPDAAEPADTGTPACPAAPATDCALAERRQLERRADGDPARDRPDLEVARTAGETSDDPTATAAFRTLRLRRGGPRSSPISPRRPAARAGRRTSLAGRRAAAATVRSDLADPAGLRSSPSASRRERRHPLRAEGSASRCRRCRSRCRCACSCSEPGACWESRFAEPAERNDTGGFRGTAD